MCRVTYNVPRTRKQIGTGVSGIPTSGVRYTPTRGVNTGCGVLIKAPTKTTLQNTAVCYVSQKFQAVYSKPQPQPQRGVMLGRQAS